MTLPGYTEAERVRIGTPPDWPLGPDGRCHDCRRLPGEVHDWGCDAERCPRCGGQAISCRCWPDEDEA